MSRLWAAIGQLKVPILGRNRTREFYPEANALSRLSYGRIGNSVSESTICAFIFRSPSAHLPVSFRPIEQVLGSQRTNAYSDAKPVQHLPDCPWCGDTGRVCIFGVFYDCGCRRRA